MIDWLTFGMMCLIIFVGGVVIFGMYKTFKELETYPYYINSVEEFPAWNLYIGKPITRIEVLNSCNLKITFIDNTHIIINSGEYILNVQTPKSNANANTNTVST